MAALAGANLDVEFVDQEKRNSKDFQKLNPTGRFPLLQVEQGVIAGTWPVSKYIAKQSNQLQGGNALSEAKVNQWIGWNATQLYPTSQLVMGGVYGTA